jgi:hypothetical protein
MLLTTSSPTIVTFHDKFRDVQGAEMGGGRYPHMPGAKQMGNMPAFVARTAAWLARFRCRTARF